MRDAVYLHIGSGFSVKTDSIVGIFDMDNTTVGKCTKKLLEKAEKDGICIYTSNELPKSFIVTVRNGETKIYISQLAATTLKKRLAAGGF